MSHQSTNDIVDSPVLSSERRSKRRSFRKWFRNLFKERTVNVNDDKTLEEEDHLEKMHANAHDEKEHEKTPKAKDTGVKRRWHSLSRLSRKRSSKKHKDKHQDESGEQMSGSDEQGKRPRSNSAPGRSSRFRWSGKKHKDKHPDEPGEQMSGSDEQGKRPRANSEPQATTTETTRRKEVNIPSSSITPRSTNRSNSLPTRNRPQTTSRRPVGLFNFGTSCFFNAVMQNLNQTVLLHDILLKKKTKAIPDFKDSQPNVKGHNEPLTKSLIEFYSKMSRRSQQNSQEAVNPSDLFARICDRSKKFKSGQWDSHELLRHLLDGLRIEERQASVGDRRLTAVDELFGGHLMTVYVCQRCQQPYHVCEPMLDISLPIAFKGVDQNKNLFVKAKTDYQKAANRLMEPLCHVHNAQTASQDQHRSSKRRKPYSVEDCLEAFTRTDYISNEYLCTACNDKQSSSDCLMTSATKRSLVFTPPAILTLHLKRFEQASGGFAKCDDQITFKETLDLGPYCSSFCERHTSNGTSIWYSLYGLVKHSGSLKEGHYVAYVKMRETEDIRQFLQKEFLDRDKLNEDELVDMVDKMHDHAKLNPRKERRQQLASKGTWFYISDINCRIAEWDEVRNCQAYLLFYERLCSTDAYCTQDMLCVSHL